MTSWAALARRFGAAGLAGILTVGMLASGGPAAAGADEAVTPAAGPGLDFTIGEGLTAGLGVAWEAGASDFGATTGDTLSIGPHLGWEPIPGFSIDAGVGFEISDEPVDLGFAEETASTSRLSGGIEAGYTVGIGRAFGIRSYLRVEGEWELEGPARNALTGSEVQSERYGGRVVGGLRFHDGEGLTASVEAGVDSHRPADDRSATLTGTLRLEF